jgi:enamine deaminase RidA (YjgF/YER057c/UK114 family)
MWGLSGASNRCMGEGAITYPIHGAPPRALPDVWGIDRDRVERDSRGQDEHQIMTDGKAGAIRRVNPPELGTPPGYSQVVDVRASRIVFIAGQTALDRDGESIGRNDFAAQADQVFRNLSAALQSVGCTASDLVKLTVFLRRMSHLPTYREARNRFFATVTPPAAPAVTLVEVSNLYGPDFLIEIEAVAAV